MESPGWPIASSGLWSSGLRVLRSAVHRPSAYPGLPGPALSSGHQSRRCFAAVSTHIAALREPALPGLRLAHPLIPIVVGIRVPTENVAVPLCPMQVGKGIRWRGGLKGWTKGGGLVGCWPAGRKAGVGSTFSRPGLLWQPYWEDDLTNHLGAKSGCWKAPSDSPGSFQGD